MPSGRWQASYVDPASGQRITAPATFVAKADALSTSEHHQVVVVDTMIASAWLGRTVSARRARWADTLGRSG